MEDSKPQYCKFCLSIIHGEKYEVIENVAKDILDVLLSKLGFDGEYKHVMLCNVCSAKLSAASEFKSTCLRTENTINSYVDNAALFPLDLREIFITVVGNEYVSNDIKICRLCMQLINDASESIREEYVDMLLKIVPEMNVFIVKEPVVCKPCLDSLDEHTKFLKQCSDEKQYGCFSNEQVSDVPSPVPSLDLSLKIENVGDEFEDLPDLIKQEHLDVNDEVENESNLNGQKISSFEENMKITEDSSNIYKCEKCDYKTTNRRYLVDHVLVHKDPSEVQTYKCETCNYKTRSKSALSRHVLLHKNPSESQMYKCENCKFVTTHLTYLKRHTLRHKDASEVQMYKCESCNYKCKHMTDYRKHMLVHKDPSEVQMYKCESCSYESKRKKNLAYHMLVHKSPSQVQMYKCENCSYETRYKMNLNRHILIHKDRSEVHMYKCEHCCYESKFKKDLKSHAVTHKDSSEVRMFLCEQCSYETYCKSKLKQHILKHKDTSEVQMYKCQNCNYESKRKENLKNHMLLHKDPTEVQM